MRFRDGTVVESLLHDNCSGCPNEALQMLETDPMSNLRFSVPSFVSTMFVNTVSLHFTSRFCEENLLNNSLRKITITTV